MIVSVQTTTAIRLLVWGKEKDERDSGNNLMRSDQSFKLKTTV